MRGASDGGVEWLSEWECECRARECELEMAMVRLGRVAGAVGGWLRGWRLAARVEGEMAMAGAQGKRIGKP
jgi:hypothetical protein